MALKGVGVVDARQLLEGLVLTRVARHHFELFLEDVFSVAPVVYAIVHNQLNHNFFGVLAMERKVLSVFLKPITIAFESFFQIAPTGRFVLCETLGANVFYVVFAGQG